MDRAGDEYSFGLPSRRRRGTCVPSDSGAGSGSPCRIEVSKMSRRDRQHLDRQHLDRQHLDRRLGQISRRANRQPDDPGRI
jgi:hypothetical protein